ncbi:MAG: iron-containing alcohol dehydrogenase [Flavobacteriaceae bacterium]
MKAFNFFVPTQIRFGVGRLKELKELATTYGQKCLLVSRPLNGSLKEIYSEIIESLQEVNIEVFFFDEVVPNPTIEGVENGVSIAVNNKIDFVLGVGGGSVLDTAKLIAFLHNSKTKIDWDKAISEYDNPFSITPSPIESLPFIAIPTTSGTGSHCTQAAVVSDVKSKNKITLFHRGLFPVISIVDPELMCSVPVGVTAATGFDAFTHAFESFLGGRTSTMTEQMSLQAIQLVLNNLPKAISDPKNIEVRTNLAWADTLAGMCLANGGADLPHPLGEIIGGICPRIAHGDTLAIVYPAFLNYKADMAPDRFIQVANHLNLKREPGALVETILNLLKITDLSSALEKANLTQQEMESIKSHPLLSQLQPENIDRIYQIMDESLNK